MSDIPEESEVEEVDPVALFSAYMTMKKTRERALDILEDVEAKMNAVSAELAKFGITTAPVGTRAPVVAEVPTPPVIAELEEKASEPVEVDGTENKSVTELAGGGTPFQPPMQGVVTTEPVVDPTVARARAGAGVQASGDETSNFARDIASMMSGIAGRLG